ncbi:MAG: RpiB/LacA/LacB family sugar-phosphate isomerase [Actinobacteria bacterium]|jgi:ribose 5-phosphate isomerase B|nr:RpiB/LacA/LacB family sugar-phosphate isomerase [Actinomycetota bacterium]
MHIAFGTDEEATLIDTLLEALSKMGHSVDWIARGREWPEVGRQVGEAVADGQADFGVVCCWTGTGVSISANKVRGVRAALCTDALTAQGARRWNDANVVALSIRLTSPEVGREILEAFFGTDPDEQELERISMVEL